MSGGHFPSRLILLCGQDGINRNRVTMVRAIRPHEAKAS